MQIQRPGIGIKLPLERSQMGYFNQSFSVADQVKSNLTNLILTQKGERLMQPDFGCDIYGIIFDPINDNLVSKVFDSIQLSVSTWLPYVSIANVEIVKDEDKNAVYVKLSYYLTNLPEVVNSVVVSFTA
jgi:phage baseplate assembly protein W